MDAIGIWYFGIRNLCKSMAGQARAIFCRIDDHPRGHSLLLLLAQAQGTLLPLRRSHTIRFGGQCAIVTNGSGTEISSSVGERSPSHSLTARISHGRVVGVPSWWPRRGEVLQQHGLGVVLR